ncbi:IMPACT family protein [Lewinella sp. IMCC34191]|uniref:IMPACT family protein n=1 Tax=Lewinella sp. IMCC34191 TaxID=2259172 RepID=UPI0018E50D9A|nr:YigZ family protein [Lewinella sp. IMCC34191]
MIQPPDPSPDQYHVPAGSSKGEFRDRGSKFIAALFPVRTEEEALAAVEGQRIAHPKCNHHCYAYRLGQGSDRWRANDDGEPSGTAGKPILGQIDKAGLSDVAVVVSRYFGGTKLGTSGLINAYREAARLAIIDVEVTTRQLTQTVVLEFGYELMSPVMSALSQLQLEMANQDFGTQAYVELALPRSTAPATLRELQALIAGVYVEEVDDAFSIPGLSITLSEPSPA